MWALTRGVPGEVVKLMGDCLEQLPPQVLNYYRVHSCHHKLVTLSLNAADSQPGGGGGSGRAGLGGGVQDAGVAAAEGEEGKGGCMRSEAGRGGGGRGRKEQGMHEEWGEGGCVSYAWTVARKLCSVLRPIGRGFSGHFDLQPTLTPCTNLGSVLR